MHLKFEELYNDVNLKVDEIAERILALDRTPLHSFTDYQAISNVKEVKRLRNGATMVKCILKDFKGLIAAQRTILIKAGENGDEGTVTLMSDYIAQQDKDRLDAKVIFGFNSKLVHSIRLSLIVSICQK